MPKHEQLVTISGMDQETILITALEAFKKLGWNELYAGDEKIITITPQTWGKYSMQVLLTAQDGQYTISSEMTHGESFDLLSRNKKNTDAFIAAFTECQHSIPTGVMEEKKVQLTELREKTKQQAQLEAREAAEVDAAMNLSSGNMYLTYGIMAVNIIVFVLMALDGAGIFEANGIIHMKWGSNFTPLTLGGDWWRLISNTFIHFGIIHLAMNMYALFMIGIYLEPMLGKIKFGTAYLCTGVLASVVSLWWHKDGVNGAGASGAIFGMYGVFLALLTTNLIPEKVKQSLLPNIGIFVGYNIIYGLSHKGIDNSAHIGGLISGFVLGYILVIAIKKEKLAQKAGWALPLVLLLTIAGAYGYLSVNKVSAEEKKEVLAEIKNSRYKDAEKYKGVMTIVENLQDTALNALQDSIISDTDLKTKIDKICRPSWNEAQIQLQSISDMDVSEEMHKRAAKLLEYVQLRKNELDVITQYIGNTNSPDYIASITKVREQLNTVIEALKTSQ